MMKTIERMILLLVLGTLGFLATPIPSHAQQAPEPQQGGPVADPVRDLNLSPEQRERIRAIREELKDERAAINQRLRQTNLALDEVLDSDNPDDAIVERRLRDVAEAQAASMRMRVMTEMKVRRVLTPEQLVTLRALRQTARDNRRERQRENNQMRRQEGLLRRGIPGRNTIAPINPKRINPNRQPLP